jgi:signal transduction histidine kinase
MDSGPSGRLAAALAEGVTEPATPRPRWLRRGRFDLVFVADLAVALISFAATTGVLGNHAAQLHVKVSPGQILLVSFMVCAPLVLRTRYPLTAWTVSALAMIWANWLFPSHALFSAGYIPAGVLVYVLCLYAVALRCKEWVVVTASVVTVAGAAVINWPTTIGAVLATAIPVFVGVIVRSRRGSREQLEIVERRYEGERALLEERQRIARELHDVVAHHMSVIAIQAEAAPYKTADPPKELVDSFAEIRASALSGLNELRRVLGVLRSDRPDVAPQPGLGDLDSLLESARNGGVTVTASISGTPRPISEGVDLSAYRIVQEALSNAMRHAPGAAVQVKLYYGEAALVIEVRNNGGPPGARGTWAQRNAAAAGPGRGAAPGPGGAAGLVGAAGPRADSGGGHGIIGMRERAAMLGGHLTAGPAGNGDFLVTAALPLDNDRSEDTP